MPVLSDISRKRLGSCHADLQRLVEMVAEDFPILVICGHRNKADQDAAFAAKASKLKWPHSRHNTSPSEAVDLAPLPLNWNEKKAFKALATLVKAAADKLGVEIEWGGDWAFYDGGHFQLKTKPRLNPGTKSG